jgi:3',5'-cyclic AMP phosphodiesterase CpdA
MSAKPLPAYVDDRGRPLFSWLHLSDIHLGHGSAGHQRDQQMVLNRLVSDLSRRPPAFQHVDAVFVTGDIAFSGGLRQQDEYEQATSFLAQVCKELGIDKRQVYVVPGNHDVQRETESDNIRRTFVESLRDGALLDGALAKANERELLEARFANYRRFAASFGESRDALWWTQSLTGRQGLRIRLLGLNSALLCLDDSDHGKLQFGLTQLDALLPERNGTTPLEEYIIVLTHHPLEWLQERDEARRWIRGYAHLHLCGHMHDPHALRMSSGTGSDLVQIMAGTVHAEEQYTGRTGTRRIQDSLPPIGQGYNLGSLVLSPEGQLHVCFRPRAWSHKNKRFQSDTDCTPDGNDVGVHKTFTPKLSPALEPEDAPPPSEAPPPEGPRVFDTTSVSAVCESLDAASLSRLRSMEEFLDFMARSFEHLFLLQHQSLDIHPFFKNVRERLKAMTPGISLNESDGVLLRANVRHVILRTQTLLELMRQLSQEQLRESGLKIGTGAARDLIRHTLEGRRAIPANPEAFVALWDYWDRTGGWGKLSLDSCGSENPEEAESHARTWRLRVSKSFLCVADDPEETHKLSEFWCGYIHGFLAEALPAIEREMAQADLETFRQKITFPAYNQIVAVQHVGDGTTEDVFEVHFQEHRFSAALAAVAESTKWLEAQRHEVAMVYANHALVVAEEMVGRAAFEDFLAKAATDEERDTVGAMKEQRRKPMVANETIARRWSHIAKTLVRKLADRETPGAPHASPTHPHVH